MTMSHSTTDLYQQQQDQQRHHHLTQQGFCQPHLHDVLCPTRTTEAARRVEKKAGGHSSRCHVALEGENQGLNWHTNHLGNRLWYVLIAANKTVFETLNNDYHKHLLVESVVRAVKVGQSPPGRFLARDGETNLWYEVGNATARSETLSLFEEQQQQLQYEVESDDDFRDVDDEEQEEAYLT